MGYLVLARKYRPQSFAEMAGQEHVVRTLANALRSGHLAHAFLFTGPRGVGKTTSARLVAKCLNCEKGPTAEPCGACPPCVEIAEGRAVDVIEIDAASNNGVDNVRDIVEAVKYRPARDRFKIYIVDEVHMLSPGAFNALLKTLEEPPEHVKFVLATTDVHKVPETIVSRCQRFDFRRLTQQQLVGQLRKVADAEGLRVSDPALALVARSAEGGMRDALSMLDQVRAACGDEASDAAVAEAVGAVDGGAVARLGAALLARDGAAVLSVVEALHARGQEMKRVAEELTRHLRNVVVAKLVPQAPLDLTDDERREVVAQAGAASAVQLTRLFDLVLASVEVLKQSEQPRYAFEVALLEACFLAPGAEVRELVERLERLGGSGGAGLMTGGTPGCAGGAAGGSSTQPLSPALSRFAGEGVRGPAAEPVVPRTVTPALSRSAGEGVGGPAAEPMAPGTPSPRLRGEGRGEGASGISSTGPTSTGPATDDPSLPAAERWRRVVIEVERVSPAAAHALKQGVLERLGEGEVALRVPAGVPYGTAERRKGEVEGVFARFFGRTTRLLLAQGAPAAPAEGVAGAGPSQSLAAVEQTERDARSTRVRAAARAHPKIQEAARILDGDVTKIEEL